MGAKGSSGGHQHGYPATDPLKTPKMTAILVGHELRLGEDSEPNPSRWGGESCVRHLSVSRRILIIRTALALRLDLRQLESRKQEAMEPGRWT
jgi:hypothetical protein